MIRLQNAHKDLHTRVKHLTETVGSQREKLSTTTEGWERQMERERKHAEEELAKAEQRRKDEKEAIEREAARLKRLQAEALKINDPKKARAFLLFESMKPPEPKEGGPPRSSLSHWGDSDKYDPNAPPKSTTGKKHMDAFNAVTTKSIASIGQGKSLGAWKERSKASLMLSRAGVKR